MTKNIKEYRCESCGRTITEEYETYNGLCEECYEIDELDYEDDYG